MLVPLLLGTGMYRPAAAQQPPDKTDTAQIYGTIETFSKKNGFAGFLYPLIFKHRTPPSFEKKNFYQAAPFPYEKFEGKIIRKITIVTLDPFGYSVNDTTLIPQNFLFKTGNQLHIKTQTITLKNIALIRENEPFDSLLVKESLRLIRGQNYIRDVAVAVQPVEKTADSVDVYIRAADKWSFIPNGHVSTARATAGFTENNFIGLGHEFQNAYTWNYANGKKAFSTAYGIPNIRNSYISAGLLYNVDEHNNFAKALTVERPFYSPLAQWEAGLNIAQQFQSDTSADTFPGRVRWNLKFNTQDFWAGKAQGISKGNTEDERTTKAIIAARYLRVRYLEKPDALYDPLRRYSNEDFYIAGVGISRRKYFQDNFIFNFGVVEDVPVGNVYGITGGYQIRNNAGRFYLGTRISQGDYHQWGYVSSSFEYGTFFSGPLLQQGVFAVNAMYFSPLFKIGNWRIRQFIKPQVTWGLNRFPYDSLTINNENGIRGFTASVRGTKKIIITFQTQSYAPWNVLGFKFGPYLNCSLGALGSATSEFEKSSVYSQIGIGALIKNNFLLTSDFQFSIAYYPSIPGNGFNNIKANAYNAADFGFRDFIFGKPEIVPFQ